MSPLPSAEPAAESTVGRGAAAGARGAVAVREYVPIARRIRLRDTVTSLPIALVFALRDFQTRYKQSLLGPLWLIIQPLSMVGGFTVIFGSVAEVDTGEVPYVLFVLVGTTVWLTFQLSVLYGTRAIVANKGMIKSLPMPRVAFVTSTLLSSLPQLAFTTALTFAAVLIAGQPLLPQMLLLPVFIAWLLLFTFSVTLPLAAWHARFRDVGATIPFLFQAGVLLSPVAYPLSEAPPGLATVLQLNPLSGILETWRWCLLGSEVAPLGLGVAVGATAGLAVFGWWVFGRAEVRFADVV